MCCTQSVIPTSIAFDVVCKDGLTMAHNMTMDCEHRQAIKVQSIPLLRAHFKDVAFKRMGVKLWLRNTLKPPDTHAEHIGPNLRCTDLSSGAFTSDNSCRSQDYSGAAAKS